MTRWSTGKMALYSLTLVSGMWLGAAAPAQAISDEFELKATFKERCKENPRFVDPVTIKVSDGFRVTFTRDDSNPTHLQATIDTQGVSPDIDAIPLAGRAHFSNKTQSALQFTLSGVNPGNPGHFLTLRGQGTVDSYGHLKKVTGTILWQETTTYTIDRETGAQSAPVECFSSGTFGAGKNLTWVPPPPIGTLRVTNAPANVGGRFVSEPRSLGGTLPPGNPNATVGVVTWFETFSLSSMHGESLYISFDLTTGEILSAEFNSLSVGNNGSQVWTCGVSGCIGGVVNRTTGRASFTNMVLPDHLVGSAPPITLNGILRFTPF